MMPLTNGDIQEDQTRTIVFNCLEKKDEKGKYMYWSVKEIADEAGKVPSTIHYYLNPFKARGVLDEKYAKSNPQVPVFRIKNIQLYLTVKEKILSGDIKMSERTKLRPINKKKKKGEQE